MRFEQQRRERLAELAKVYREARSTAAPHLLRAASCLLRALLPPGLDTISRTYSAPQAARAHRQRHHGPGRRDSRLGRAAARADQTRDNRSPCLFRRSHAVQGPW